MTARDTILADGTYSKKVNRPTLLWPDRSQITMKEARTKLGFETMVVHSNLLYFNAASVEKALQERTHDLGLGRRCWRKAGAGGLSLYRKWDANEDLQNDHSKVIKVFLTFSRKVPQMLADGELIVND